VLQVVPVLVGDDIGDREVADRASVAGGLARQSVDDAAVEVGGELLRDVDRVVGRAVERRVVAGRRAASAQRHRARGDPVVAHARLRQAAGLERARPVAVDVLEQLGEERLDRGRLVATARANRRARALGAREDLLEVREHLADAVAEPVAALLELLARPVDAPLDLPRRLLDLVARALDVVAAAARQRGERGGGQQGGGKAQEHVSIVPLPHDPVVTWVWDGACRPILPGRQRS
jgi:hypothetical protein